MPKPDFLSDHRRQWLDCCYVYPVISRRSRGLSVGVNLNIDKRCNFACRYCQINRRLKREAFAVDIDVLEAELRAVLSSAADGTIWDEERFGATPEKFRRINDIAFSGDGEPTTVENFPQAVAAAAHVKAELGLDEVQIVIITNATRLGSETFATALEILRENNGHIWAKLDAGTDDYFQRVNR
ncbi:MAG: radical SAM protein, partial [Phycisphaerales bacterium]|nr:radical SAM protein [Phycisphaerales bacterium]